MYHDHLKFCVVCIAGHMYVCCSEYNGISNKCHEPTSCLLQPIGKHGGEVMYFGYVCFRGDIVFLNCDDNCMCVVNKQFELHEFVFDSVYVDLLGLYLVVVFGLFQSSHASSESFSSEYTHIK